MGSGKPSSPVTTLLNHPSLLRGSLLEGEWDSPGRRPGWTIARGQDFIPGAGAQIRLSRDFTDGCRTWDPEGHAYDVSVRFSPCRVYPDLNRRDTLEYEWPFAHYYHLIVCLIVLDGWLDDGYSYVYHNDYYIILFMISIALLVFCLFMHIIVYRCKHNIWLN
jgi:hypothetical protein